MSGTLDLSSLKDALTSLEESMHVVNAKWFAEQSAQVKNTLMAGVIQHFEIVYELCIKMMKRRMELGAATPSEIDFSEFRDLLRTAAEKGLVSDVEAWFEFRKMRNITSHTYSNQKAMEIYGSIQPFVTAAKELFENLKTRKARKSVV